jgi:hypothetical protein
MLRSFLRLGVFVLALAFIPSRLLATPVVINFDGLSELDSVTNQYAGLTFSNATVLTAGSSLNELEFPPHSPFNVVFDDGGPIRIDLASPVSAVGGFFTYGVPLFFEAFDAGNNPLGSTPSLFSNNELVSGDPGSSPNEFLQLALSGISHVTITGDPAGGSFVLDDFTYTPSATPVPEPATLSLVLLGGVGLLRSRRRLIRSRCG